MAARPFGHERIGMRAHQDVQRKRRVAALSGTVKFRFSISEESFKISGGMRKTSQNSLSRCVNSPNYRC
eukprot:169672-Amorphochlora_amoeboformis.AAC.1